MSETAHPHDSRSVPSRAGVHRRRLVLVRGGDGSAASGRPTVSRVLQAWADAARRVRRRAAIRAVP